MIIEELKSITLNLRKNRNPLGPTMQFHLSELAAIGKNANRETTNDEAIQYLKKTVAKLKDNEFHNQEELDILESLLPNLASMDEVRDHIFMLEMEEGLDISNKGMVMKAVKEKFGNLVDLKMVNKML